MKNTLSLVIARGCTAILALAPMVALYFLIDIQTFLSLASTNLAIAIQWHTVTPFQAYMFWLLTCLSMLPGLVGLYYLRRAFANFALGELFNETNSTHLKRFSQFLAIQALATPLHLAFSSLLLSINHPAGQKILSISFGSNEIKTLGLAVIFWVISDLLVKASQIEQENKQFV